jgi:succinyl-CoA synthetase beta subunit
VNIHEYQAKELYRKYGIPVPKGIACMSPAEATAAAKKLIDETGNEVVVVKAQIHAGGRGKAGGVKVVKGVDAATAAANEIFGKTLITHQTGPLQSRASFIWRSSSIARAAESRSWPRPKAAWTSRR